MNSGRRNRPHQRIVHIGVAGDLPGGMAQVLREYEHWSDATLEVRVLRSTKGRGDWFALFRWVGVVRRILSSALLGDSNVAFVVHVSQGGSFIREGSIALLAKYLGFGTALHIHGSGFVDFAQRRNRLVAGVLRRVDEIYCLTDDAASTVEALVASSNVHLVRVRNAVDVPPESSAERTRTIFMAGQQGRRKGSDTLLESWSKIVSMRPEWNLLLAGPLEPGFEIPSVDGVTYLGSVSHESVREVLLTSSIAVLPSRGEALPMFLLEAMASGCATVGSNVGQVGDLLQGCGVVVAPADSTSLTSALLSLIDAPEMRIVLGRQARSKVSKEFSSHELKGKLFAEWLRLVEITNVKRGGPNA